MGEHWSSQWAEISILAHPEALLDTVLGNLLKVTPSQRGELGLQDLQRSCSTLAIQWTSCGAVIAP